LRGRRHTRLKPLSKRPALYLFVQKHFIKHGLRAVLFCLDFALFAQHSDENCPGIVKKYATARNNRSRLIKVMPL
ncbi:hypothetical protein, partial [Escherichia coli]|uniref:hypothetical protein n=1 Tax=Escherichia coli TaxID=562 RepID=UPI002FC78064